MRTGRLRTFVLDCKVDDLDAAARFWSSALGRPIQPPSASVGASYRALETKPGEPLLLVQQVRHDSRIHLDIQAADDLDAEVKRLEGLGAKRVEFIRSWWVMEAPTGQRFCVDQPSGPDAPAKPDAGAAVSAEPRLQGRMHRSRLSTFVIDCKVDDLDAAARFWSGALGRRLHPADPESPNYRELDADAGEPTLLVQQVGHDSRIHLDIESDDIEAEVKRLEGLGAKRVAFIQRWQVMEAPTGQRFCVVRPQRGSLEGRANVWSDEGA